MNKRTQGLRISIVALFFLAISQTTVQTGAQSFQIDADGPESKLAFELIALARANKPVTRERVTIILQFNSQPGATSNAILKRSDVKTKHTFLNFNARLLELPFSAVQTLAMQPDVKFISPDREAMSAGHISLTTGADAARTTNGVTVSGLDGTGTTIAILDSGIDITHTTFLDRSNILRVVASRDFTGEGRTDDPYGHGTHVASIAAGNGRVSNAKYVGIAPNANLVNLRVLNSEGKGTVSGILSALDWLMTHRKLYNIRVANLSLGTAAVDSYRNDVICNAVRRLTDAGVVVVAAAGNNGRDSLGNKIYGQIHSPGNEPSALTVGATNSYGTDPRFDDGVATFSSRGPTRSGWTDALGIRHHDNLIKPDLVAPGNKIVDAAAANNFLLSSNPELDAGVSSVDNRRMMYLNGTSMAAPATAGAAALLLQINPTLTPNLIKVILMYTAQPLAGFSLLEQGAGQVNIEGAVRLARLVRTDLSFTTPLGTPLLSVSIPPYPRTTIAGNTFTWAQGIMLQYSYAGGEDLITKYQKIYDLGVLVTDGVLITDGVLVTDHTMLTLGVLVTDYIIISVGGPLADGLWYMPSGVLVTDNIYIHDGVLVTDSVLGGDSIAQAMSATAKGDTTLAMTPEIDSGIDCLNY